ncbi:MAG: ABC transporter substrate-binding protein [Pseudomonadota bacterium]
MSIFATFDVKAAGTDANRVLAIGGSVTEIVYALGEGGRLIARDTTSTYPEDAKALPNVGYMRALSPEGVLSVNPDLILAEEGMGPPETVAVLTQARIPLVTVPDDHTRQGIVNKVLTVGRALGVEAKAEALAAEIETEMLDAEQRTRKRPAEARKRVLFVLSASGGRILASGTDTAAAGMIDLAGGINAVTEFDGYKPLTDEALAAAAPDVILMMDRGGDHSAADETLFELPAIATTPAGVTRSVVRMNGLYLLGFGPRTARAIDDLSAALYGG